MRPNLSRHFSLVLGLVLSTALLAVACGGGDEEEGATPPPPPTTETAAPAPTGGAAAPGAAGIASNPREPRGLEGILELDDGLAMFTERPAGEDRTGVTADTILIGRHSTITSPNPGFVFLESTWGPFIETVFDRINEAGGIHGRQLQLITRDDAYSTQTSVQAAQQLVQEDQIFAMLLSMGGPPHTATHDYLEQNGMLDLFNFAAEQAEAMDTSGEFPVPARTDFPVIEPNIFEGYMLVDTLYKQDPDAQIAVVYQGDSYGDSLLEGMRWSAQEHGKELLAEISYDIIQVDLTPQAQEVVNSGATAVAFGGSPTPAIAFVKALREGFGSDIMIAQRGSVPPLESELFDGIFFNSYIVDPWTSSPDDPVAPKLRALAQEEGFPYHEDLTTIAYLGIEHLIRALELAGPDLTREGLLEALESGFTGDWTCHACVAPTFLSPTDHWATEAVMPARWSDANQFFCSVSIPPEEGCRAEDGDLLNEAVSFETSEGRGFMGNAPGWDCAPDNSNCPWKR